MQHPRARRRHADVRREPAVRVDFVRRVREDGELDPGRRQPFERRQEEGDVAARFLEIAIAGKHIENDCVRPRMRRARNEQRFGRRRQTRHDARGHIHPAARDGGL
jgi:hypothetical protein